MILITRRSTELPYPDGLGKRWQDVTPCAREGVVRIRWAVDLEEPAYHRVPALLADRRGVVMSKLSRPDRSPVSVRFRGRWLHAWGLAAHQTGKKPKLSRENPALHLQVLIYVDVAAAMADGIKFFRSSNNVILSGELVARLIPDSFRRARLGHGTEADGPRFRSAEVLHQF